MLVEQFPIERAGMIEIHGLARGERDLLHAAVVGIQGNDGRARQTEDKPTREFGLAGARRTGNADNVRSHVLAGGVTPVYNERIACRSPSMV